MKTKRSIKFEPENLTNVLTLEENGIITIRVGEAVVEIIEFSFDEFQEFIYLAQEFLTNSKGE